MGTSKHISTASGNALLKLARQVIEESLGKNSDEASSVEQILSREELQQTCGTFVTLKKKDQLRGCIGSLVTDDTIVQGVRKNAINSAFHDYRFSPVKKNELDEIDIEISILTEPEPLEFKDAEDLIKKLRPGIDGVILRKKGRSATFLPQVWEQLPRTESFLSHLSQKAGLSGDAWKDPDIEVMTYQVQYFEE